MDYRLSLIDEFVVCVDYPLSQFDNQLFGDFFQPLLSNEAVSIFHKLHGLVNLGFYESSKTPHKNLLNLLKIDNIESFQSFREELEAIGLLDTFVKVENETNLYIYILKKIPTPWEFFKDHIRSTMLENAIGKANFLELGGKYLVHKYDLHKFERVTKSLDEVYFVPNPNDHGLTSWWVNPRSAVNVEKYHFDYEYYNVLLSARNVVDQDLLNSAKLYNEVNRLAWMFGLSTDDLVDATILSIVNNELDIKELRTNCRKIYTTKNQTDFNQKFVKIENNYTDSVLVNTLNSITPAQLVENKYHTKLTGSEIELFDRLLIDTNISVGVLNALIIYVMDTKNGEIPSYNYFLKIVNTWIRKGIKTTEQALDLISNGEQKPKTTTKVQKKTPTWFNDYINELESKDLNEKQTSEESLKELEQFFNNKKGK